MVLGNEEPNYDQMELNPSGQRFKRRGLVWQDIVLLLVALVAVVALVLSTVALSRLGTPNVQLNVSQDSRSSGEKENEKIWVFAIGHDGNGNLEYIDKLTGTLRGFHVDLVEAVCTLGNKNCQLMWDVYKHCYESKAGERPRPGKGLLDRWYDACTGWYLTFDRISSVSFTKPFRKAVPSTFYVKRGNPNGFDTSSLVGKKIGFINGDATNEFCLVRAGLVTEDDLIGNIVHFTTRNTLTMALNNTTVDAVFANTHFFNLDADFDTVGDPITTCMQDGAGMMFRKDSRLPDWWNPTFDRYKQTTKYKELCSKVTEVHDNSDKTIDCVDY